MRWFGLLAALVLVACAEPVVDEAAADEALSQANALLSLTFQAEDAQAEREADGSIDTDLYARCAKALRSADETRDRQRMRLAKLSAGIGQDVPSPPDAEYLETLRTCG